MKFFVISLRKNLFMIIFVLFAISLITFSENNLIAAKNGLALWANSVVPTLLPFFIATELLCKTNFVQVLGNLLHKFIKPIFNVPGESVVAIILGIISGYPVGAKVVCNLYENKICSKPEAERLIAFTNNSGPIFILGTVGIAFYKNVRIGKILLITHILSALIVGLIFRYWKKSQVDLNYRTYNSDTTDLVKISNLGEILGNAINKSISNILMIGGFVLLFSVVLSILSKSGLLSIFAILLEYLGIPSNFSFSFLSGFIEITNGIKITSDFYLSMPTASVLLSSFLLGFGGISVMLQVYAIISKYHISIKSYFYGKIMQGIIAVILTAILI